MESSLAASRHAYSRSWLLVGESLLINLLLRCFICASIFYFPDASSCLEQTRRGGGKQAEFCRKIRRILPSAGSRLAEKQQKTVYTSKKTRKCFCRETSIFVLTPSISRNLSCIAAAEAKENPTRLLLSSPPRLGNYSLALLPW
jgi:hypothetical protein